MTKVDDNKARVPRSTCRGEWRMRVEGEGQVEGEWWARVRGESE